MIVSLMLSAFPIAAGAVLPQTKGSASEGSASGPSTAPSAPKLSIHARWQEEALAREQTFKDFWDALAPLRPVPGRTRSLQLPVYRSGHTHLNSIAGVRPFTLGEGKDRPGRGSSAAFPELMYL
jgi:hypothetical protein